ncbi:MAG: LysR substrate-binding domain-containing protein [Kiloniellales bacterium]
MSRLPVHGLEVFLAVAEQGSLRAAAAALGVQPPAVSHQLKVFEEQIGVSLFARTTRSVRLTDAGRALLRRAQPALSELGDALEEARGVGKARKGSLRITLPTIAYHSILARRLADFQALYPEIELELSLDEAFVDIVGEGFHAGIRLGDRIRENMIALRLTPPIKEACFAAPSYFATHGRPQQPRDLLRHRCIRYRFIGSKQLAEWRFRGPGGRYSVEVKGQLIFNSFAALITAARDGLGIGWTLRAGVENELACGALESVLDDHVIEHPGFFLYFPKENARLEILRLFIDFMKA